MKHLSTLLIAIASIAIFTGCGDGSGGSSSGIDLKTPPARLEEAAGVLLAVEVLAAEEVHGGRQRRRGDRGGAAERRHGEVQRT